MRLADANVVAQGNIPPLEVRLDLQPGDLVGLYEEVRHSSMGAGYSPVEAVVLGSPEPGWFVGETEDGREVTFHADQVADVQMGSPAMGSVLDWFKRMRPPLPSSTPALPQQPRPLALPPPAPKESKGIISQIKTMFSFKEQPQTEKKSIFDIFKKSAPASGLPTPVGPSALVPAQKKESFFSILNPESKVVVPFSKQVADLAVPKGPLPLAPYIEKFQEVFKIIPKSPEPPPKPEGQPELWGGLFETQKEGEERPIGELFKIFTPEEIQPAEEVMPPDLPARLKRKIKVLPMPRRTSLFPSVEDVARGLMGLYNPIEELWQMIRDVKQDDVDWKEGIEKTGVGKAKWESIGTCGGYPTLFQELSALMHIPWEEFLARGQVRHAEGGGYDEFVEDDQIWLDIVFPSTEIIIQALDLIKPPDLKGQFGVEREEHREASGRKTHCMLTLTYTEGEEKAGAHQEWVEENQELSPEQVVAKLKEDDADPREVLAQLESEIFDLIKAFEALDPESGTYREMAQEISGQIEYRKAIINEMVKEMGEEASPQEIARSIQESIEEEEKTIIELTETLEKLSPGNKELKDIADQMKEGLKKSKENLRKLTEELSNLPEPESKRSPTGKKKSSGRGGRKGKS